MAKPNTPLLSLEAHGSIGNVLTHQGRGRVKIAREKPELPYSLTLPQRYQRWLYEDYAYLWRQQSQATKDAYRTAGVRFHRTGFQQWMSVMLSTLPDIAGWWKLDEGSGAVAYDSGRNANNGTIIGASPIVGMINGAFYHDGINDYETMPSTPSLQLTDSLTLEALIKPFDTGAGWRFIAGKPWLANRASACYLLASDTTAIYFVISSATGWQECALNVPLVAGQEYHVLGLLTPTKLYLYIDGAEVKNVNRTQTPHVHNQPFQIGRWHTLFFYKGTIDNVILTNRELDPTEILRHSLRRWAES